MKLASLPKPLRIMVSRPRIFAAIAIGLIAYALLPASLRQVTRALLAWDLTIAIYLGLAYTTVLTANVDYIRRRAAAQDDGRFFILILTTTAALASLAAIVAELGVKGRGSFELIVAVVTIALSWAAIHTTFALHYAHEYYGGRKQGGLEFPGGGEPDYWDFVYFSFVVGMTAQVSDVGISDKIIRRTATVHGIVSFVFNTALVALMVNIAASAI